MRVVWSPLALSRVEEIADFIQRDKPGAARKWVLSVFSLAESLSELPERGRVVPEIGRADVREVFHGGYRLIYRVEEDRISIATVRHGRRLLAETDL